MSVASTNLEDRVTLLLDQYQEVFSPTLGTITPFQAKLSLTPGASPKFFKPRSVPFALVENELTWIEQEGVLEKTHYSEWAAPIVVVPKPDGRLHLCGDYKVTINPVLDVDQYPLPKPDEILPLCLEVSNLQLWTSFVHIISSSWMKTPENMSR